LIYNWLLKTNLKFGDKKQFGFSKSTKNVKALLNK